MKRTSPVAAVLLAIALAGCAAARADDAPDGQGTGLRQTEAQDAAEVEIASYAAEVETVGDAAEVETVGRLVEDFGRKLRMVSLLAPEVIVREKIREHYAEYVSPAMPEAWRSDPGSAPGRWTSSPWPDRIEVRLVAKTADGAYRVKGDLVETAGDGGDAGGAAVIRRSVTLEARKIDGRWLIDAVELGDCVDEDRA